VGTPVQCALPALLDLRAPVQRQIIRRLRINLETLGESGIEAGWYAVVRGQEEDAEIRLLRERDVLVQPGYFYDFESPGCIVVSLLTPPDIFREGIGRLRSG
jgi:alanine-synthesizing transaminase